MKLELLTHRRDVGRWLNAAGLTGAGVEIGVLFGEYAEQMLSQWKGARLHLVDPWETQPDSVYCDGANKVDFQDAFNRAVAAMSKFWRRAVMHKMYSDQAFALFKENRLKFDFVYLDGNHANPQFKRDLEQWWTLLAPGALYGGHDYLDVNFDYWKCHVKSTVDEFVKQNGLSLHLTDEPPDGPQSWWIIKP